MKNNRSISQSFSSGFDAVKIVKKIGSGLTAKVYETSHPTHGKTSLKVIEPSFYKTTMGTKLIKN